ncbi:unnamed protein product, partial [Allacma fusca]
HEVLGSDDEDQEDLEYLVDEHDDDINVEDIQLDDAILPDSLTASDKTIWVTDPIENQDNEPIEPYCHSATLKLATRDAMNMH